MHLIKPKTTFLFKGDSHLDLRSFGYDRTPEIAITHREILQHVADLRPAVYVDLGDLFETSHPSPFAEAAAVEYLLELDQILGEYEGQGFVLTGNHDRSYRDASKHALLPALKLKLQNVEVVDRPRYVSSSNKVPPLVILPAYPVSQGGLELALLNELGKSIEYDKPWLAFHYDTDIIGVGHGKDDHARPTRAVVTSEMLTDSRLATLVMGHIHAPGSYPVDLERMLHCTGAVVRRTFGERNDPRSLLSLESRDGELNLIPLTTPRELVRYEFRGLPKRWPRVPENSLVQVHALLREDEVAGFDKAKIKQRLERSGAVVLNITTQVRRSAVRRNPEQKAELSLLGATEQFIEHKKSPRTTERMLLARELLEESVQ